MLRIRLARFGRKKKPFFRIIVAEALTPQRGGNPVIVGHYNPLLNHDNPQRVVLHKDKVIHWLSVGAQPSDRVRLFLAKEGLVPSVAYLANTKKSQPKKKAQERLRAAEASNV